VGTITTANSDTVPAGSVIGQSPAAGTSAAPDTAVNLTISLGVVDTSPPSIDTLTANPNVLWPPNHKMVPVTVSVVASDIVDNALACQIVSVSSNEPVNGTGDGDTAPDWEVTGDLTVDLRAERSGQGSGRVYAINVGCTDDSGNSATALTTVTVPHDQGKGKGKGKKK
jgi:hypothetical protein